MNDSAPDGVYCTRHGRAVGDSCVDTDQVPRLSRDPNVSIIPTCECTDAEIDALVEASRDPHIYAMSYHPAGLTKETAQERAKTQGPLAWLINLEGTPVGDKHIVAPVWAGNTAPNRSVKGADFKWVGRRMREHPDYDFSGICEVWLLSIVGD